jgi:hypothetical protein
MDKIYIVTVQDVMFFSSEFTFIFNENQFIDCLSDSRYKLVSVKIVQ